MNGDNNAEAMAEILSLQPHYRATRVAETVSLKTLRAHLSSEMMACLTLLLDEFGSVPLDTIPHADMLPALIAKGLAKNCTAETQRVRMERLLKDKEHVGEMPSLLF